MVRLNHTSFKMKLDMLSRKSTKFCNNDIAAEVIRSMEVAGGYTQNVTKSRPLESGKQNGKK